MSDSVRPHRWQPTRLPRPWDSPGKNTGVGCHFLLQCMKVKRESEVSQSCPTLHDPMDCSLPGPFVHGILQARVLDSIPGLGRSSEEGNGSPFQHSCLRNPMDRGAWQAMAHGSQRVGHHLAIKQHRHLGQTKCSLDCLASGYRHCSCGAMVELFS